MRLAFIRAIRRMATDSVEVLVQTDLDRRSTRPISDREVDPEGQRAELSVLFPEGGAKARP